jgi:hypothetical protein
MAQVTDHKTLKAWLQTRPPEDAVLIAARAALRVLPLVGLALGRDADTRRAAIVLPVFRAAAIASLVGSWPNLATEVRAGDAAARADAAAARADAAAGDPVARAVAYASARAIANAAACATIRAYATADAAADAADAAAHAADAAAYVTARATDPARSVDALWEAITSEAAARARARTWRAISSDATALEGGAAHVDLGARQLWPGGAPVEAIEDWQKLVDHLLTASEGWQVWIDWYDGILEGSRLDPDLELRKAFVAHDVWRQGPGVVNAEMAQLTAEHDRSDALKVLDAAIEGLDESADSPLVSPASGVPPAAPAPCAAPAALARATGTAPTVAFFSYTRSDERYKRGLLSAIRAELQETISYQHGAPLDVFQDTEDIEAGDVWRERLERALAEAIVFVPVVTPSFFNSPRCREELSRFIVKGEPANLILPIDFGDIDWKSILPVDFGGIDWRSATPDQLKAKINKVQRLDWSKHKHQRKRITRALEIAISDAARRIRARWLAAREL